MPVPDNSKGEKYKSFKGLLMLTLLFFMSSLSMRAEESCLRTLVSSTTRDQQKVFFPRRAVEHPLVAPLKLTRRCAESYEEINDYSAVFVSRERIDGKLKPTNYILLKFREFPFSVYLKWLKPHAGREAIFVEGRNRGKLLVHETGIKDAIAGTVKLDPHGRRVKRSSRHAITEAGIGRMIQTMQTTWNRELIYQGMDVKLFKNAQVNQRPCIAIQIYHPEPKREFVFCLTKVYIDQELKLPIRVESYDWPRRRGENPVLVESYTYTNLKLNMGFTDIDFDVRNPRYSFR